jgi:serine/threonine-protein kinase RsbW
MEERETAKGDGARLRARGGGTPATATLDVAGNSSMTATSVVHLGLVNEAENSALVRHVLGGVALAVGFDESLLADVKTAVSEACSNVVLHAYGGGTGPLEVTIGVHAAGLMVVVRDRGGGIQPRRVDEEQGVLGVGLSLIQALTDRVEFRGAQGVGTEVRMSFHAEPQVRTEATAAAVQALLDEQPPMPLGETAVAVSVGSLAAPVLGAVVAVLASRADFSLDRLADAQLVTDTIAAHASATIPGPYLKLAIDAADRSLRLRLGPLAEGGAARLVDATALGSIRPLEVLASGVATERVNGSEYLALSLAA